MSLTNKLYNSCLSKPPGVCVFMEYVCAMHGIPRHFWDPPHEACWQGEGLGNIWCCFLHWHTTPPHSPNNRLLRPAVIIRQILA